MPSPEYSFGCAHYSPGLGFEFAIADVSERAEFLLLSTGKVLNDADRLILEWNAHQLSPRNIAVMFDSPAQADNVLPLCLETQWTALLLQERSKTWRDSNGEKRYWSPPAIIWEILEEKLKHQFADEAENAVLHDGSLPGAQALLECLRALSPRFDLQGMQPGELLLSGLAVMVAQR